MNESQQKLWDVTEKALEKMGGLRVLRHPNCKIEGTKEWAIAEAYGYARSQFPDDEICEALTKILS